MSLFLHFDGDNVGDHIELLLLDGRLDEAITLSEKIQEAMDSLRHSLEQNYNSKIHIFAGDDLIASCENDMIPDDRIDILIQQFKTSCGITMSLGTGKTVQEALANLRRAKLSGKNRFIGGLND